MSVRERVMLDRYAERSIDGDVSIGDTVMITMTRRFEKDGEDIVSREVGVVRSSNGHGFSIALKDDYAPEEQWEVVDNAEREQFEVLLETSWFQICDRLVQAAASHYPDDKNYRELLREALYSEAFVPAGRILSGLGRTGDLDLTLFNCFVKRIPEDSRQGISAHFATIFEIFARGGGCGWNLDILRPRGSEVKKINGRSSGVCSWATHFADITKTVEQGGSRRGSSLQCLSIWHPDVEEFIRFKKQRERFDCPHCHEGINREKKVWEGTNTSILITDAFMRALKNNEDWDLVFPDTHHRDYDSTWDGNLETWKAAGNPVRVYKTVKAKELWDNLVHSAWQSGDPGLLFIERMNKLSNSWYYAPIISTNPCAEEPLPNNGICNLGHINLAKIIHSDAEQFPPVGISTETARKKIDWNKFSRLIHIGIKFLDSIIDINKYHDDDMKEMAFNERRVGLGILGLAELLTRVGLRYGSPESIDFIDELFSFFKEASYIASIELAQEKKSSFPYFEAEKFLCSGFVQTLAPRIRERIQQYGIRNVTVNTVAPTGSTGTMVGTSTGCEPYISLKWTARTRIGATQESINIWSELEDRYGPETNDWPDYVVTSADVLPIEHVKVQAAIQHHIDASVSKTVNLPNDATVEDVNDTYLAMYTLGCKGGTVYRDGSKDTQALYPEEEKSKLESVEIEVITHEEGQFGRVLRPKIDCGIGYMDSKDSPVGTVHSTIRFHPETGEPYDFFCTTGKGGDIYADAQAIGRLISVILRWPNSMSINQTVRLQIIADQLYGLMGRSKYGYGPDAVLSLPDVLAKFIREYLEADVPLAGLPRGEAQLDRFFDRIKDCKTKEQLWHFVKTGVFKEDFNEQCNRDVNEFSMPDPTKPRSGITGTFEYCPRCKNATLIKIPGHCTYCTNQQCQYSEC